MKMLNNISFKGEPTQQNGTLARPANKRLQERVEELLSDRVGVLPVWIRAPKYGTEFYTGVSRPKLYEWDAKRYIRSVSIREPGKVKGTRLFNLASILAFIEKCEAESQPRGSKIAITAPESN